MVLVALFVVLQASPESEVYKQYQGKKPPSVLVPFAQADRAVGIMDKGELSNITSNFGLLSEFHFFAPAMHWPKSASFEQQYCFGLGPFFAVKDNVVESFLNRTYADWEPKPGSLSSLFSGDVQTPDGTPIMATSDGDSTWPKDNQGKRFWPGPYRRDITTGEEVSGEFTSDRDLYAIFDDTKNRKSSLGIEARQSAYSYGRIYAQDLLFFDFTITNESDSTIHGAYWGYYGAFRPDYDFKDYLNFVRQDSIAFIYNFDADGIPLEPWQSVGMIGVAVLATPFNRGVSDFHYYDRNYNPETDEMTWPIISSDSQDPDIIPDYYFHGSDRRVDDPGWMKSQPVDSLRAWNYLAATGPFDLKSGESVHSSIVVVAGSDSADLFNNLATARLMANHFYQGSGPPAPPVISAVAGDREVTLWWSAEPSESSRDAITGKKDFEGYKVYRSDDQGATWGTPISDAQGRTVGYVPLAIYDLTDGIKGTDPAFPQWLGDDSGLHHTFTDTTALNGIEYWYCVTAYDQGNQKPDSLEPSYENGKGRPGDANVVGVVAGVTPAGWIGAARAETLDPVTGKCDGLAMVEVLDPHAVTGDTYEISFNDNVPVDTIFITTFNLVDISASPPETIFYNRTLSDSSFDNLPVVQGFRLILVDSKPGFKSIGWTKILDDTSTFDWFTEDREPGSMVGPCAVGGNDDFRITVDRKKGSAATVYGGFGGVYPPITIPITAQVVTDPGNPKPVSEIILLDYRYDWDDSTFYGPKGWDLIPGGAGYNPNQPYGNYFPDELGFYYYYIEAGETTGVSYAHLRTQNGPATAIPPTDGDQFTLITLKPFSGQVTYRFTPVAARIDSSKTLLDSVRVVPNPYIVSARWEQATYEHKIQFTHLPEKCAIYIYTLSGDRVATVAHDSKTQGYEFWDMRNQSGLDIAYGLYIYVIETPAGETKTGTFMVIK